MTRFGIPLVVVMTVSSLLTGGQGQAAPAPAAPAKAVELAQAGAPATKLDYPRPGRPISVIVPYAAGGGTSVAAQMLASLLEKILSTPFQVIYRPGAGAQVGTTELIRSKPDGYTIGYAGVPTTPVIYLDPQRKAVFNRSSFTNIASHFATSALVSVPATSPYKTLKDLVDAAKAQPEKITVATIGLNSPAHLGGMMLEKAAGVKFAFVHFDGGDAPAVNALLGGHVQVATLSITAIVQHVRSGAVRSLGIMDSEESSFVPGVKTLASQGYENVLMSSTVGINGPAGIPPEIVAILDQAIRKATNDPEHRRKMDALGYTMRYISSEPYAKLWADVEARTRSLMEQTKKK